MTIVEFKEEKKKNLTFLYTAVKRQSTEWKKILVSHVSNKGLTYRLYKGLKLGPKVRTGGPEVGTQSFFTVGAHVQSLVRNLRSCKLCGVFKREQKKLKNSGQNLTL